MPKKFDIRNIEAEEMASQLRKPQGILGKKVGEQMNNANKEICLNAYKILAPGDRESILEIGMGNGLFVRDLLDMAEGIHVTGMDYSPEMVAESKRLNQALIEEKKAEFIEGSIAELPFDVDIFHGITTTNTLYFWPEPFHCAKELFRVLKPGGKALIAYRSKSCMDQLELTRFGFKKYNAADCEHLLREAGFVNIRTIVIQEEDLEINENTIPMEGNFTVGIKP